MKDIELKILQSDTKELIEKLEKALNDKNELIQTQFNRIKELEDKKFKDKTIKALTEKVERLESKLNSGFYLSNEEIKSINEWKENHIKSKHKGNTFTGIIGGRYTYEFIPTSIGDIGTIKCSCGKEFTFRELE